MKRILCILLSLAVMIGIFAGCNTEGHNNEDNICGVEKNDIDSQTAITNDNSSIEQLAESSESSSKNSTSQQQTSSTHSSSGVDNNNTTSQTNHNSTSDKTNTINSTSSNTGSISDDAQGIQNVVIKQEDSLYKKFPELTAKYISPSSDEVYFSKNSSGIYENKYVKIDSTTGKYGYLLITYKDPWAESLWITLDQSTAYTGRYEKTYHYYYNTGSFNNKAFALSLPTNDANYYITLSSSINGKDRDKIEADLGQITKSGTISFQDTIPTEEQIKLTQESTGVYSNKFVRINTNTSSKGYIEIDYIEPNAFDIEVSILSNVSNQRNGKGGWHYYTGYKGKCKIKAALTYGNAEYVITVSSTMRHESTGAHNFTKKAVLTVNLKNVSNTGGFLLSAGEVIFDSDMMFIKKANELSAGCKNDFEKVEKIYDWLTDYLMYAKTEDTCLGIYHCDLNKVYNRKTGVCYDYAVVLAAMLRSQGIPCKVVFGWYADTPVAMGHAWNQVYIAGSGSITSDKLSVTGNKWCTLDPTLSYGSRGEVAIEYMNNPSNYIWQSYY